jgi:hypothetical protein
MKDTKLKIQIIKNYLFVVNIEITVKIILSVLFLENLKILII